MNSFFGFIAVPLGYLLSFIYGVIGNYGITLIIFTIIVRVCLFPVYLSQMKSTQKMAALQPKMQAINKRYAHDKQEAQRQLSILYKEEKYNPMSGCLPMAIQMPIIMGLFALLRNPMQFIANDLDIILAVHESFLWVADLSQPDLWILPIASGITTFISFSLTQKTTPQATGGANDMTASMAPMMKVMRYFFPVMIIFMGRSFPAGLAVYWFVGNLLSIVQSFILQRMKKKALEKSEAGTSGNKK